MCCYNWYLSALRELGSRARAGCKEGDIHSRDRADTVQSDGQLVPERAARRGRQRLHEQPRERQLVHVGPTPLDVGAVRPRTARARWRTSRRGCRGWGHVAAPEGVAGDDPDTVRGRAGLVINGSLGFLPLTRHYGQSIFTPSLLLHLTCYHN